MAMPMAMDSKAPQTAAQMAHKISDRLQKNQTLIPNIINNRMESVNGREECQFNIQLRGISGRETSEPKQ